MPNTFAVKITKDGKPVRGADVTAKFTMLDMEMQQQAYNLPEGSPGKYTRAWDGKDNGGKLVKAGTYTVYIEAAREHGTYQIIRQDMDFSGTAKKVDLPGNVEIASASLDYHRVGGQ